MHSKFISSLAAFITIMSIGNANAGCLQFEGGGIFDYLINKCDFRVHVRIYFQGEAPFSSEAIIGPNAKSTMRKGIVTWKEGYGKVCYWNRGNMDFDCVN